MAKKIFSTLLTLALVIGCSKSDEELNVKPSIVEYKGISTIEEDNSFQFDILDFVVEDPDNNYPDDFTLFILDGENYSYDRSTLNPDKDFYGKLNVKISMNDGEADSEPFIVEIEVSDIYDPPVIKGYYLRDDSNTPLGIKGTPNVKISDNTGQSGAFEMSIYPNPCRFNFYIDGNSNQLKECWIVAGVYDESNETYSIDEEQTIRDKEIESLINMDFSSKYKNIDISSFESGYYRVYMKIDDVLYYDNLEISD